MVRDDGYQILSVCWHVPLLDVDDDVYERLLIILVDDSEETASLNACENESATFIASIPQRRAYRDSTASLEDFLSHRNHT